MLRRWSAGLFVSVVAAAVVLAAPLTASAMTFRQGGRGGSVVIGPNETIDDDLYIAGNAIEIRGTVRGTVFAVGNTISIDGPVEGDVWAAANTVRLSGDVARSVHAAGNEVSLAGKVGDDITAAGNTVVLSSGAVCGRDAALAGNTVSVAGKVDRNLFSGSNDLVVSGDVGGDVNAGVQRLVLTDGSSVRGDIRYTSDRDASIAKGATVGGRVVRSLPRQIQRPSPAAQVLFAFIAWIRRLVGLLLFGLIVVLVFPLFTRRASDEIRSRPLPALGLGFAVLFGVPIAAMAAFVLGILIGGWWISLMAFALYAIAIAVGTVVVAVFLGRWLLGMGSRAEPHLLLALLVGLLIVTVAEAIPLLGGLARFAEVVFGLGAVTLALFPRPARPAVTQQQPGAYARQPPTT